MRGPWRHSVCTGGGLRACYIIPCELRCRPYFGLVGCREISLKIWYSARERTLQFSKQAITWFVGLARFWSWFLQCSAMNQRGLRAVIANRSCLIMHTSRADSATNFHTSAEPFRARRRAAVAAAGVTGVRPSSTVLSPSSCFSFFGWPSAKRSMWYNQAVSAGQQASCHATKHTAGWLSGCQATVRLRVALAIRHVLDASQHDSSCCRNAPHPGTLEFLATS